MDIPKDVWFLIATYVEPSSLPKLFFISKKLNKWFSETDFAYIFFQQRTTYKFDTHNIVLSNDPHECIKQILLFEHLYDLFINYLTELGIAVFDYIGIGTTDEAESLILSGSSPELLNLLFEKYLWLVNNKLYHYLDQLELSDIVCYLFLVRCQNYEIFKYTIQTKDVSKTKQRLVYCRLFPSMSRYRDKNTNFEKYLDENGSNYLKYRNY
jgi:hypothetical protein